MTLPDVPLWGKALAIAVLAGVAVYGVHLYNEHFREQGRAEIRAADADALAKAKTDAQANYDRLTGKVTEAANANKTELEALRAYRDAHPLHGGLCLPAARNSATSGSARGQVASTAGTSTSAPDVQPLPAGDIGPGGQADPDVRGMLDALAARADQVSAGLRSCTAVAR